MDINKYIASGNLEQYVLGTLSLEEQLEVESLMRQYPAIKEEIEAIELSLEQMAQMTKIQVPYNLENAILNKIDDTPTVASNTETPKPSPSNKLRNLAMIGGILALGLASIWGFSQKNKHEAIQKQYEQLNKEYLILKEDCAKIQSSTNQYNEQLAFLRDVDTKPIEMKGTDLSKESLTILYWNENKEDAYLDIASLPTPPSDKQYQLWAIVDGKPVDIGVFDLTEDIIKIPSIENPQAFAITLEKLGGVESPTLDQMYVIGNNS